MRLLFVADGRSPIALNWIRYFVERGDEVHLASTFACQPDLKLSGLEIIPVAFSNVKSAATAAARPRRGIWGASTLQLRTVFRQWLGPLTIPRAAEQLRGLIQRLEPDLIHALRIPYEGMLAAQAAGAVPLAVSVWGNDFTLHAPSTPLMRYYTALTLKAAGALQADCERDIRLAKKLGFAAEKPTLVTPGSGGIRAEIFYPPDRPAETPLVVNPRGFRAYVRNDVFFQAIPLVLREKPEARFACAGMAGERQALDWIEKLGIGAAVELLPPRPYAAMAELFRSAQVLVSPTIHDGTPNTLLEGMACGCLPVAGDLESIREWITPGENGLLVEAGNPTALAAALLRGLNDPALRQRAAKQNAALIAERAEYTRSMARAVEFYEQLRSYKISGG
jgi:glycosyltransferase involved in cell wall biosynthesis